MKYQNFIMRVLCLILILGAVIGYNSMEKKETESTQITELIARVEELEKQQKEILTALEEAAKAQEEAKAAREESKAKETASEEESALAEKESSTDSNSSKEADKKKSGNQSADSKDGEETDGTADLAYQNGTYTGEGQGFGGTIQVEVTLEDDTITDIQVVSAPGEDSAYLSQGKGVISTILDAQSTDVDTISGATFSSTGIINAVNDALGKAENK